MKSHIYWYIDQRVLYVKRPEIVTLESLAESSQRIIELFDSAEQPVHIINDALNVKHMPKKLLSIRKSVPFLNYPHLGWFITLSNNPTINFLGSILPQLRIMGRQQFRVVYESKEALAFLKKQDETIDWTKANLDAFIPGIEMTLDK